MSDPITVVCPECHAAAGARCTRKVTDGSKFIEQFHQARVDALLEAPPALLVCNGDHSPHGKHCGCFYALGRCCYCSLENGAKR